ncbi:purine and uridine phosphorylase [Aspergillus fijiensis CBS 313.89]|uniref:Purine and uridine phosphorylase n=1 Tax=Aspergillus fijiensis CBS 313.89 TaxID=1448319 RepID=A0A8G1W1U0_9EURO|nr:purine and uridine phosphorylase [Aspergillus fijiensis CBS 313.89]RAK80028.1 purine and uridine phosphorylase [Aspergillus fijiensis CBS 313.89]
MLKRKTSPPPISPERRVRTKLANQASLNYYTVGWICALEEEYECGCRMLDEVYAGPETLPDGDDNTYAFGRIRNHGVVVSCLPAGRYGTESTSRVARDMVRTFPRLRFALLVGIGGGAPTAETDIRLGDVVVSTPHGTLGGVIQYDLGKRLPDGRFKLTGQLNAPPDKLLSVVGDLRRRYKDPRKPDFVAEHIRLMEDMSGYQRPQRDDLYRAEYQHEEGKVCEGCDVTQTVSRPQRSSRRVIAVHHGTIASGNPVIKDAATRDFYAHNPELKVLCFDREAAGVMNNLPCLVIRGIGDYADSHDNEHWRKYAALTAAAYARELLLSLRSRAVDVVPSWVARIEDEVVQVARTVEMIDEKTEVLVQRMKLLEDRLNLVGLPRVNGAVFNERMHQYKDECLEATCSDVYRQIAE